MLKRIIHRHTSKWEVIRLSKLDYAEAAYVGFVRGIESLNRGLHDRGGFTGNSWEINVRGSVGELVAARVLEVPWACKGIFMEPDTTCGVEVRTTARLNWKLKIYREADDNTPYMLVAGGPLDWVVQGWIMAGDGKLKMFWDTPQGRDGAYFVDQEFLRPISELRRIIQQYPQRFLRHETAQPPQHGD